MNEYRISNKELIIFFIVNFGLATIMGLAMSYAYTLDLVDSFPTNHMYYPALAVMVALLLNKKRRNQLPKKFFIAYIFFVLSSIIFSLVTIFLFQEEPNMYINIWASFGSLILFLAYSADQKDSIESYGLKFINFKKSLLYIGVFILLYFLGIFISSLYLGDVEGFIKPLINSRFLSYLLTTPISFALGFMPFLGEEYGWRFFLQPALQERLGKRKGVIVLGLIWGIWHLPINMFYYSPETPIHSVLNQLIGCTYYSIFFGYIYMKTNNIWTISIIHYINNSIAYVIYGSTSTDVVFTSWQTFVFNLIVLSIIYGPFLLTKEYKESVRNSD